MHVAGAALERAVVEDGRRAGAVIERVDDLASLVDGPRSRRGGGPPLSPLKRGEGLCKFSLAPLAGRGSG